MLLIIKVRPISTSFPYVEKHICFLNYFTKNFHITKKLFEKLGIPNIFTFWFLTLGCELQLKFKKW